METTETSAHSFRISALVRQLGCPCYASVAFMPTARMMQYGTRLTSSQSSRRRFRAGDRRAPIHPASRRLPGRPSLLARPIRFAGPPGQSRCRAETRPLKPLFDRLCSPKKYRSTALAVKRNDTLQPVLIKIESLFFLSGLAHEGTCDRPIKIF
jgi:hypothetical protein